MNNQTKLAIHRHIENVLGVIILGHLVIILSLVLGKIGSVITPDADMLDLIIQTLFPGLQINHWVLLAVVIMSVSIYAFLFFLNQQRIIKTDTHKVMDARAQLQVSVDRSGFMGQWSWDGVSWASNNIHWETIDQALDCAKRGAFIDYINIKAQSRRKERAS